MDPDLGERQWGGKAYDVVKIGIAHAIAGEGRLTGRHSNMLSWSSMDF